MSFLGTKISDSSFFNCIFINCYFRKTDIRGVTFQACKFIDCDFPDAHLSDCNLNYSKFKDCFIDADEISQNLSSNANTSYALTHNLFMAASDLGKWVQARKFRRLYLRFARTHFRDAAFGKGRYYREHYKGLRFEYFIRYASIVIGNIIWKNADSAPRLFGNAALFLVVYPVILFVFGNDFAGTLYVGYAWSDILGNYWKYCLFTLSAFLSISSFNDIAPNNTLGYILTVMPRVVGLVFAGLLVAILLDRMVKR